VSDLAERLGSELAARNLTLATAESCTGGLLADTITDRPGASAYFLGGVIVYSNASKTDLLGVPPVMLARHGAVSGKTALSMAYAVMEHFDADMGIAITGIAGPGGGTPVKPVGATFIALASRDNEMVREFTFNGSRREIKAQAADAALELVLEFIESR